ncbi:MAG: hypothetical protein Q8P81_00820 [Nanoarchaeota archaeon]|nr:hypothetical protein [Nanoarchaeota archaeon]
MARGFGENNGLFMADEGDLRFVEYTKEEVRKLHKYRPDCVFLTEAAAVPNGYALKEAWKKAYPGEAPPRFYRIDPKSLNVRGGTKEDKDEANQFFKKRIHPGDRVFVYDEWSATGASPGSVARVLKNSQLLGLPDVKCGDVRTVTAEVGNASRFSKYFLPEEDAIIGFALADNTLGRVTSKTSGGYVWKKNTSGSNRGLSGHIMKKKDFEDVALDRERFAEHEHQAGRLKNEQRARRMAHAARQGGTKIVDYYKTIGREAG